MAGYHSIFLSLDVYIFHQNLLSQLEEKMAILKKYVFDRIRKETCSSMSKFEIWMYEMKNCEKTGHV